MQTSLTNEKFEKLLTCLEYISNLVDLFVFFGSTIFGMLQPLKGCSERWCRYSRHEVLLSLEVQT